MQAEKTGLYVEALHNEQVQHDVIKTAPVKLSAAVALAKDSRGWGYGRRKKSRVGVCRQAEREEENHHM